MHAPAPRQLLSERAPIMRTMTEKSPLVDNNSKLGKRLELLEEQLLQNSQLGAKLQVAFDEVLNISKKLGSKMHSVETSTLQSVNGLGEQIGDVQRQLQHVVQIVTETQRSQEAGEASYTEIKGQLARALTFQQMRQISNQLCDQICNSDSMVGALFKDQTVEIKQLVDSKLQNILSTQGVLRGSLAQLATDTKSRSLLQDQMHAQFIQRFTESTVRQQEVKAETDSAMQKIHLALGKMHKKTSQDTPILLGEIASVQKALQIPYTSFKRPGDSKRLSIIGNMTGLSTAGNSRSDDDVTERNNQRPTFKRSATTKLNPRKSASGGTVPAERTDSEAVSFHSSADDVLEGLLDDDDTEIAAVKYRDFSVQTMTVSSKEHAMQTDPVKFEENHAKEKKKKKKDVGKDDDSEQAAQKKKQTAFAGADKLKAQAHAAAMKKPYLVTEFYWTEGWAQKVARNKYFENLTLCVVAFNALWISIDLDLNKEALLLDAHPVFIIAENLFCLYFTAELCIRFGAFEVKADTMKDAWFVFDFFLVSVMILETWLVPIVFYAAKVSLNASFFSTFRMLRLGRLLRLTRLTKLARNIPELLIVMKGLAYASRSVCMFFALWITIVYVFAIIFSQLLESSPAGHELFKTIPESMDTLLLTGVFGSQAEVMHQITEGNPVAWPLIVFFMALVSLTIMYMLIGVMNDSMSVVASTEKNKIEVSWIVSRLRDEVERLGHKEEDMRLTTSDLQTLSLEPGIIKIMQEVGVDVVVFADMLEMIFEETAHSGQAMSFEDFVGLVLNTRGQNPATVKDTKEQIKVTKLIIKRSMDELQGFLNKKFKKLQAEITALADDEDDDDDDEE